MLWSFFAMVAAGAPAAAQRGDARLTGTVVDKRSGAPIARATVVHSGDARSVTTDSAGKFEIGDLPSGIVRFVVRAAGFPNTPLAVALSRGESMVRLIELDSTGAGRGVQTLPQVDVAAPASLGPRFADFERRKATGRGHYLTSAEITKGGYSNLQGAVRGMRGVTVECGGGAGCFIRMVRAPMQCKPDYVVDERVDNFFGPNIAIRDIEALEVYTGPSDVPAEFAGRNAGCGVIVIWTKSGPRGRRPG